MDVTINSSAIFWLITIFSCFSKENARHTLRYYKSCDSSSDCTIISNCPGFDSGFGFSLQVHRRKRSLFSSFGLSFCGLENFIPKICCPLAKSTSEPPATTTTTTSTEAATELKINEIKDYHINLQDHENLKFLPLDICGSISDDFRIAGGVDADPEEFPWMVLIAYKTGDVQENFRCGGSLISQRYVLTAAHCIDSTILGVRLGVYNVDFPPIGNASTTDGNPRYQDILISKIMVHPKYDKNHFLNDISLMRLASSANFSFDNIRPICLPIGQGVNLNLTGQSVIVAGWGNTETGHHSPALRKVSLPVMSLTDCRKIYHNLMPITVNQICAGSEEGKDSCAGDSGCPLKTITIFRQTPRYVQYGIVSYGPKKCGLGTKPGVYTRVSNYLNWILNNIEE